MNLGFASPVSLQLLRHLVKDGDQLPPGYQFAPSADWVQELMKRRHHIYLYTTAKEVDAQKTFYGDGITIRIARQRNSGTGRDLFIFERDQLQEMMAADQCDLIHAHWTYQFALAAIDSRIPTLITIHDLPWRVLQHFRDFHRAARLLMAYQVAMRGKHFTAVSKDAASHFRRYLKLGANITVIPNGLPDRIFSICEQMKPHANAQVTFATVLQGWSNLKNATTALKAFDILRRAIPGAQLQMFGVDYEPGGPAQRWASQNHLDVGVAFIGPLKYGDLLARIRRDVDIVVHPSLNEAFSMTALEAMALKKLFIAGKATCGMQEMLDSGRSGVLVDVTRPSEIAKAMIRVAQDRNLRDQVAQYGFDRASSEYRLEGVINKYEAEYSRILHA